MKTVKWLVSIGVTFALFATVVKGFTIDGSYEAGYGSALSTQVLGTSTGVIGYDNTVADIGAANGSELDAAYGVINNGVLYLFFAGNLSTGGNPGTACTNAACNTYDKLNVFIMSDSGAGGDHTLGVNYNNSADSGGINRMGVGGNGSDLTANGLTFDTGFSANYWIGVTVGGTNAQFQPTVYANYEVVCGGCAGAYMGNAAPTNMITDNNGNDTVGMATGIQVALNNSNINGVWGDVSGCYMYGLGGSTNDPLAATTGVEMAIPLSTIGGPLSSVSVCAFITGAPSPGNGSGYEKPYNQSLGPVWDGTTSYCNFQLAADSSEIDFSNPTTAPGTHHFTIPVPACSSINISYPGAIYPYTASYTTSVSTGSLFVTACSWSASTNASWLSILSGGSGSGSGTITYSVGTNTTINGRTADLFIYGPVGGGTIATQTVTILQEGVTLPPLGAVVVDGTKDPGYGCPLSVQAMGTGYGKSTTTNVGTAGGSELDAAYGLVQNNTLFLLFAGKLESNGNHLHVFFMTKPGHGTNTIVNVEPLIDGTNTTPGTAVTILRDMAATTNAGSGPGLTFDPGFTPNYWMNVNIGSPYHIFLDYAQLWPDGTNALGVATNGYFVGGSTVLTNGTLIPGSDSFGAGNPFGIQLTVNNSSHTNGVDGNSCITNVNPNAVCYTNLNSGCAVLVTNGIEFAIPLGALGSPTGQIAVCAFIGGGQAYYMSNQVLPPIDPTGTTNSYCVGNLAGGGNAVTLLNFGGLPGGPHYFNVGPEMRVTGVAIPAGTTNVAVSFLPANNTNMQYQLQRRLAPLTNSVASDVGWAPVGGVNFGGLSVITVTDPKAATNKVGVIYRVRQSPTCN